MKELINGPTLEGSLQGSLLEQQYANGKIKKLKTKDDHQAGSGIQALMKAESAATIGSATGVAHYSQWLGQ